MNPRQSRTFPNDTDSSKNLHGKIFPEDIRKGDHITASVKWSQNSQSHTQELQIYKISPLGIELLPTENTKFRPGQSVEIQLNIYDQVIQYSGLVIDRDHSSNGQRTIGIRLESDTAKSPQDGERRSERRWSGLDGFHPTAMAVNPARFNDYIFLKVVNMSPSGLQLSTSLRNKFIVAGLELKCILSFPLVGQTNIKLKVMNVRVETSRNGEQLIIGTSFKSTPMLRKLMGQYTIQFGEALSIAELKNMNLPVKSLSMAMRFKFVQTPEEYKEVLKLRHKCYLAAKKIPPESKPEDMADSYDARSRIIVGYYKGILVSTARMVFMDDDGAFELEEYIKWPKEFPDRHNSIEVTRTCTHPDYRGTDLLASLLKYLALTSIQAERDWIIIGAVDELMPLYNSIGFQKTEHFYSLAKLNNLRHRLMVANVPDAMCGKKVNPIVWNLLWKDLVQYMRDKELFEAKPLLVARLSLYRALTPIAWLYSMGQNLRISRSRKRGES